MFNLLGLIMAKNKNRRDAAEAVKKTQTERVPFGGVSRRGWKVIGLGIGIAAIGYVVLSFTDPAGQNWASNLCPFLILGGYATIGVGIVLPDSAESSDKQNSLTNP